MMDEVAYWVCTRRAPCLMTYDEQARKRGDLVPSFNNESDGINSVENTPIKKTKRKLSVLEDESISSKKEQNLYFKASQPERQIKPIFNKTPSHESDVDFDIKNTSLNINRKKNKLKDSSCIPLKKMKMVTSTPKIATSTPKVTRMQKNICTITNGLLNNSFQDLNPCIRTNLVINNSEHCKKIRQELNIYETTSGSRLQNDRINTIDEKKINTTNGHIDDYSDVSGFTANYIRSTKAHTKRTLRSNTQRNNNIKFTQAEKNNESGMIICANKAVDTTFDSIKGHILNCSSDSSQNIVNLVGKNNKNKPAKVNRGTTILKLSETKLKNDNTVKTNNFLNKAESQIDLSFQSSNNSTRYLTRHRRSQTENVALLNGSTPKKSWNNTKSALNIVEPESLPRTRSGRSKQLTLVNHSAEISTSNLICKKGQGERKLDNDSKKDVNQTKTSQIKRVTSCKRDSLRDRSGFTACFSDNDDSDTDISRRKKFFC